MQLQKMKIIPDTWLSKILNRKTYRINVEISDLSSCDEHNTLCQYLQIENVFLYVKVPSSHLELVHLFQKANFRIMDVNLVFEKNISTPIQSESNLSTRFSIQDDQEAIRKLARNNFRYSRFHMDNAFLSEEANLIKAEWANNFFLGQRGKWMIVSEIQSQIVGFLLLLEEKSKLVIDLICVDTNFQGQGLAMEMIHFAESELSNYVNIQVGTQIINLPSIRLYLKTGFFPCKSYYILHYHN